MPGEYTDHDTARARQAEALSSAGLDTQQLERAPQAPPAAASGSQPNTIAALVLIVVGVVALFARFAPPIGLEISGGLVLLTIASCFLFFAFWQRIYGLMIPGSILAGLSVGVTFADITGGVSVLWGLALGFMSILFLGQALFNVHHPWPAIPSVILFAVGTLVAVSQTPAIFAGGLVWLPLLLIGAGIYLGWMRRA